MRGRGGPCLIGIQCLLLDRVLLELCGSAPLVIPQNSVERWAEAGVDASLIGRVWLEGFCGAVLLVSDFLHFVLPTELLRQGGRSQTDVLDRPARRPVVPTDNTPDATFSTLIRDNHVQVRPLRPCSLHSRVDGSQRPQITCSLSRSLRGASRLATASTVQAARE